jgi:hypothetical protein
MNGWIPFLPMLTAGPELAQPAPYWLLTLLHWLTFALHLVAMNLLFGLLLIVLFFRRQPLAGHLGGIFTKLFPVFMAATITLGVAPLLFTQVVYGNFFYSASIVSGWNWFFQIPVVLVTYYLLYLVAMRKGLSEKARRTLLVFAAAGFGYISYTFTMISDLAEKPGLWPGLYRHSPAGWSLNPDMLQTVLRWAHVVTGAVTVAGVALLLFARYHPKGKEYPGMTIQGGRIFRMAAPLAAVLAVGYLLALNREVLIRFLQSPGLHAILTAVVINLAVWVWLWRRRRAGEFSGGTLAALSVLVFAGVCCMVIGRHFLRIVLLGGAFDPAALPVTSQWGPLVMFLATFVAGLAVLFWMLRIFFQPPSGERLDAATAPSDPAGD